MVFFNKKLKCEIEELTKINKRLMDDIETMKLRKGVTEYTAYDKWMRDFLERARKRDEERNKYDPRFSHKEIISDLDLIKEEIAGAYSSLASRVDHVRVVLEHTPTELKDQLNLKRMTIHEEFT